MSVQFGRWIFAGESPAPEYLEKVSACIAPYGPDSNESYSGNGITILYRAFHTTKEARYEKQPHICRSGEVITWDGRLDNRDELIEELKPYVTLADNDVRFVAAAFNRWGRDCFAKLIGDWALSIWDPRYRSLLLAKDPIGPRHLYYAVEDRRITWCTVLDPLVLFADRKLKLCEEYIAGWLSLYPATHLTPYVGIHALPASTCVFLGPKKHIVAKYWDFDPNKKICYRSDREYEEHFRSVFFTAVRRRLRSDMPILAELSGGRDSSSIVCVADEIIARGQAETPRLDTISYYDDSEPNWNERPFFTKVEKKRGRAGWHIDVSLRTAESGSVLESHFSSNVGLVPVPGYNSDISAQFSKCVKSQGNRVVLSGVGGDEVMGGAPTPEPELQDLLARARFAILAHQLKEWALQKQKPWFHLFLEAALGFLPPALVGRSKNMKAVPWLQAAFFNRHWAALAGYPSRVKLFGALPSFQDNLCTLQGMRRQLASNSLPAGVLYEKSYPYLDRSLVEFMYAIPKNQSVRPAQRRSLMRRALVNAVPTEILNRKRKASVARTPLIAASNDWANLVRASQNLISNHTGIIDQQGFIEALMKARRGEELHCHRLVRAIHIERWLRHVAGLGITDFGATEPELPLQIWLERWAGARETASTPTTRRVPEL